jgi:hypothetical protein
MKAFMFAAFLTVASAAGSAQTSTSADSSHYTHSQVKAMIRSAKTPADYLALRDYYNHLAETNRALAAEEKQEWERRSANPMAYARKYPSPVDSAHYLYDSYVQSAKASADNAQQYDKLAGTAKVSN